VIESGQYGQLWVAKDPQTLQVTGFFQAGTSGELAKCAFFVKGTEGKGRFPIKSFSLLKPQIAMTGHMLSQSEGELMVILDEDFPDCVDHKSFSDTSEPATFVLTKAHPKWTTIRMVKLKKVFLFATAALTKKGSGFVNQGDPVVLTETKGKSVHVDRAGPQMKNRSGWIPLSALQ